MADFNVSIQPDTKISGNYLVNASGQIVRQTTASDRSLFGLTDDSVKNAIQKLWNKRPNNIFFNDPTNWGDQTFARYNWPPLKLNLRPVNAFVSRFDVKNSSIEEREVLNRTDLETEVTGAFQTAVENVAETSWSQTTTLEIAQEIGFDFEFFGSKTTLTASQAWQKGGRTSQSISIGSSVSVKVPLAAKSRIAFSNIANIGKADIEITYEASLTGGVFVHFDPRYQVPGLDKSHYFYFIDINAILATIGVPNSKRSIARVAMTGYQYSSTDVVGPFPITSSPENAEIDRNNTSTDRKTVSMNQSMVYAGDFIGLEENNQTD